MENTIENAIKFLEDKYKYERSRDDSNNLWIKEMVAYASACSAPSSIGENEIEKEASEKYDRETWIDGVKWAISRLSERKIVLPSEQDMIDAYNVDPTFTSFATPWNACIESIKRLNGINPPQNEGE